MPDDNPTPNDPDDVENQAAPVDGDRPEAPDGSDGPVAPGGAGARGDEGVAPNREAEHGGPRVPDRTVAWRMFAGIGGFVVLMAALYWFTSYEDAGSVLLLLAAALSLWFGTYLWLQQRRPGDPVTEAGDSTGASATEALYLPHASVWPLVIGVGAASIANGLVLGIWVIVPGVAALALGIGGFVRQSRRRD